MQDPEREIVDVITLLTSNPSPSLQASAIREYMTPDVGFRHPACLVEPGPNSREQLLGVYKWYKTISPTVDAKTNSVHWDREKNVMFIDFTQRVHLRFNPFEPSPGRFLIRLTLRYMDGLHYIAFQEDFVHTDDMVSLVVPPLAPVARMVLSLVAIACNIGANLFSTFGVWSEDRREKEKRMNGEASTVDDQTVAMMKT